MEWIMVSMVVFTSIIIGLALGLYLARVEHRYNQPDTTGPQSGADWGTWT